MGGVGEEGVVVEEALQQVEEGGGVGGQAGQQAGLLAEGEVVATEDKFITKIKILISNFLLIS